MKTVPTNKLTELSRALDGAADAEIRLGRFSNAKDRVRLDNWQGRLDEIVHIDLPEKFGKLVSRLDLQKPFVALGIHVRSFKETAQIVNHLSALISERLDTGSATELKLMDDLIALCDEMKKGQPDLS